MLRPADPNFCPDRVATARIQALKQIFSPIKDRIDKLLDPSARQSLCCARYPNHYGSKDNTDTSAKLVCDDYSLGLLVRLLSQDELYPLTVGNWRSSIWYHIEKAKNIVQQLKPMHPTIDLNTSHRIDHSGCSPGRSLTSGINAAVTAIPSFLMEEEKAHLNSQGKKTGLNGN
jgi:hypothetical protein